MKHVMRRYAMVKSGEIDKVGYLFPDNVLYWERKGWTVILKGIA